MGDTRTEHAIPWRSRVQVGCGDDERSWAQSRNLYNTGFHRCNRRAFPGISRTVKMLLKERLYSVVDVVGDGTTTGDGEDVKEK